MLVIFVATLIRTVFGFADALVAMPLLVMIVGLQVAAPLVALMSLTNALVIFILNRKAMYWKGALRLILASIVGIPIGLYLLKGINEQFMRALLAVILISFSLFKLYNPEFGKLKDERWAGVFGLIAGVLGGAYNVNGPAVVVYASMRTWSPDSFRATLQGYFFLTGIFIVAGHAMGGLWTDEVLKLYLYSLPVLALAYIPGSLIHKIIPAAKFDKAVYILLLMLGGYLLMQTW